jgi:cytidine deaminase
MAGECRIIELLIMGKGPALIPPCDGCRQRLHEFADGATPVHICDSDGLCCTVTLGDVQPLPFGPPNLSAWAA